jgi:hypothetical protein
MPHRLARREAHGSCFRVSGYELTHTKMCCLVDSIDVNL